MHSAEIKWEIPFCTHKQILEYSGIEIRQFTHSAEIKREIPFCTHKRSETYVTFQYTVAPFPLVIQNSEYSVFPHKTSYVV